MGLGQLHDPLERTEHTAPEEAMARILSKHLEIEVTPEQIGSLFDRQWFKLSALAHAIHEKRHPRSRLGE